MTSIYHQNRPIKVYERHGTRLQLHLSNPKINHDRPATRIRSFNPFKSSSDTITSKDTPLANFPDDFPVAIRQASDATQMMIADGAKLVEVDFPTASLSAVAGDAEGANESTYSMQYLRQYCRLFQQQAAQTRIFFPDEQELKVARFGKSKDPNAGSWDIEAVWDNTKFQLDYLTKPSGLLDIGLDLSRYDPSIKVKDSDDLIIIAYPNFDPREMVAADKVWNGAVKNSERSMIMFNAELDRLRSNYYPPLFYPQMARLTKEFIPLVETAYYIHNFKGVGGGALFRVYPGPWQVLLRLTTGLKVVHTQQERPSLKEVALEILPAAVRRLQQQGS